MGAKNAKHVESESAREQDEVLVVKGVAERRILGVHELVLA